MRKRPGMYVGPTDGRGFCLCIYILVDHLLDGVVGGECHRIEVTLLENGSCRIWADGPGAFLGCVSGAARPPLEEWFTQFKQHERELKPGRLLRPGQWGGTVVVNAVSERFSVTVTEQGLSQRIVFAKGRVIEPLAAVSVPGAEGGAGADSEVREGSGSAKNSVEIEFQPDLEIFASSFGFSLGWIHSELSAIAAFFPGLELHLTSFVKDRAGEAPYHAWIRYPRGLKDYVSHLSDRCPTLFDEPLEFSGQRPLRYRWQERECEGLMKVQAAIQFWKPGPEGELLSFVNGHETREGGTHVRGLRFALLQTVRDLVESAKAGDLRDLVVSEIDCIGGLVAVVAVEESFPSYYGGSKEKYWSPIAEGIVYEVVSAGFRKYLRENPPIAQRLVSRALKSAVNQRGQMAPEPKATSGEQGLKRAYFHRHHERLGDLILAEHHGNGQFISRWRFEEAIARSGRFAVPRGASPEELTFTGADGKEMRLRWDRPFLIVAGEYSPESVAELVGVLNAVDGL